MLTENQLSAIREYLFSKKLPIDLLMEVQDHFIQQILDLQQSKNLNFEVAFQKTKEAWFTDLRRYWSGGLDLEDTNDLVRRARREMNLHYITQGAKYTVPTLTLVLLTAQFATTTLFLLLILTLIVLPLAFLFYRYIKYYKEFKLAKKYQNYMLTLHQQFIMFIVVISPLINIIDKVTDQPEKYQLLLSLTNLRENYGQFLFILLSLGIIFFTFSISIEAQTNYLRQIRKLKPFLKYLS